jgi:hypothetical protein
VVSSNHILSVFLESTYCKRTVLCQNIDLIKAEDFSSKHFLSDIEKENKKIISDCVQCDMIFNICCVCIFSK